VPLIELSGCSQKNIFCTSQLYNRCHALQWKSCALGNPTNAGDCRQLSKAYFTCLDLRSRTFFLKKTLGSIAPRHDNWAMHGFLPREVLFQAANSVDEWLKSMQLLTRDLISKQMI
jgi:hypothetical protein